jgi:hypothetical protein
MNDLNLLAALGLSQEELQERVIERATARLFEVTDIDEDGDEFTSKSPFAGRLEKAVRTAIDNKVAELAEAHVLPLTGNLVESIVLQQTTKWGEKVGKPMTIVEYMTARAEEYLREEVSYDGKAKSASDSYSWKSHGSRVSFLVHQHLHSRIEEAMKAAVKNANDVIVGGLEATVKQKLGEIAASLKVTVAPKN